MNFTHNPFKAFFSIALIISIATTAATAQTYSESISANRERAGGVYHYYEYVPSTLTKAPKGYKAFYISHYGRHGSRYHSSSGIFSSAKETLDSAKKAGILTTEGIELWGQIDTLMDEHMGMFGMLTERGAQEHQGIAQRMHDNYPSVFSGKNGRTEIDCISSYWPRCLVSMANCSSTLLGNAENMQSHYLTGPKYLDYISMDLDVKDISKEASKLAEALRDKTVPVDRFFKAIFNDQEKALKLCGNPQKFMERVFLAGSISPNTIARPDIFKHFTDEELVAEAMQRDSKLYYSFGIGAEHGDYEASIAKPLIEDIIDKADDALKDGSKRAADLRFGHDVGLLPLIGAINIDGMEKRFTFDEVRQRWMAWRMIPMASNIQMIFFKNKKGDVLVKIVYNERETTIPALPVYQGPFYRWEDLRGYLQKTTSAISNDHLVKDSGDKERTGVAGM